MFSSRLRKFNKRVTNKITGRFANSSRGPFAIIHHVGRKSGKPFETTIMVEPMGDGFMIALTYGEAVDWYRNLVAAGHCTIFWHGKEYRLGRPEPVDVETALKMYPTFQRMILRLNGTPHFVHLKTLVPELVGA